MEDNHCALIEKFCGRLLSCCVLACFWCAGNCDGAYKKGFDSDEGAKGYRMVDESSSDESSFMPENEW